jgi:hypothetical protein
MRHFQVVQQRYILAGLQNGRQTQRKIHTKNAQLYFEIFAFPFVHFASINTPEVLKKSIKKLFQ